jgi:hypothetical protein
MNEKPVTAIAKAIRRIGVPALAGLVNVQTTPQFHAETVESELRCASQQIAVTHVAYGSRSVVAYNNVPSSSNARSRA